MLDPGFPHPAVMPKHLFPVYTIFRKVITDYPPQQRAHIKAMVACLPVTPESLVGLPCVP